MTKAVSSEFKMLEAIRSAFILNKNNDKKYESLIAKQEMWNNILELPLHVYIRFKLQETCTILLTIWEKKDYQCELK